MKVLVLGLIVVLLALQATVALHTGGGVGGAGCIVQRECMPDLRIA